MSTVILKYRHQLKTLVLLKCAILVSSVAQCQDKLISIKTTFSKYHQNSIKEKIFVHTDKTFYITGEILWFKLYVVDASTHVPLNLSKVAYVEVLDTANNHLLQAKVSLNNAEGNGSFYLPVNLNSGNFKLRAYTNWMKNFGAEYFFEKNITIVNTQRRMPVSAAGDSGQFDIRFFPEGGNMVNNIPCKVAFRGADRFGKSVGFTGFLLDNNDTLLSFKPQHAGMGVFSFTPLPNHSYKAFIQTGPGQKIIEPLPAAYNSGYVMNVSDSAGKVVVNVLSDMSGGEIYLFVHTREIIKVTETGILQNGKAVFIFDKENLGPGISHITIFNGQRQPVCERLVFKKPSEELALKINSDKQVYNTRENVSLHIDAGTNIKSDTASLSMSVLRLDSIQHPQTATISSYLLLTSDLTGYVEDPNYYFRNDDVETIAALDNVMLTNGWRRFKWEDVFRNKKPYFEYVPEYNGPIVVGRVTDTKTGNPVPGIETYISVPGFQNEFNSSTSDKNGTIKFEMKDFYGSSEIFLQTNTANDRTYRFDVADPFSSNFSSTLLSAFTLIPQTENSLRQQSVSMQVQNIYSGKKLKQFVTANFDTTPFYLNADETYLLDNYTRFTTLEEVLREYVALVDVRKKEGNFHFGVYNFATGVKMKDDPLVLLDGVAVFKFNKLMEVDPLKLYKVEVLNRKYFLGNSIFDGILNWTSYKGDLAGYDPGQHTTIIDYDGLQTEREFYSPSYDTREEKQSHLPDFRNVLLWSPHIKIASGASKEIDFYTSDIPGKYLVEVQGISKSGLCGNNVFVFEVKR